MKSAIDEFFKQHTQTNKKKKHSKEIYKIDVPIHNHHPISWLGEQCIFPKFYLSNRDHNVETACLGAIYKERHDLNRISTYVKNNSDIFFCGGTSFDQKKKGLKKWKDFGNIYFFIPRFCIKKSDNVTIFSIFIKENEITPLFQQKLISQVQTMFEKIRPLSSTPICSVRNNEAPSKTNWISIVKQIQQSIRSHTYEKIVLARESHFRLKQSIAPEQLLASLSEQRNTIDYYLQISSKKAFLGRSPEYLFKRTFRELYSEAVAGTLPIKLNAPENKTDIKSFVNDIKSKNEHGFVVSLLNNQFKDLCSTFTPATEVIPLEHPGLIHLFSNIKGQLKNNITDADIIKRLHPTPAVGGFPKRHIFKLLKQLEPFTRGWYAAPIGIISKERSEMAVAIRSMLINKKDVFLYAGAGIIKESDPQLEWDELEQKTNYFKSILNG